MVDGQFMSNNLPRYISSNPNLSGNIANNVWVSKQRFYLNPQAV